MQNILDQGENTHWIQTEFGAADLRDDRLNKRLRTVLESLCAAPECSLPQANGSWDKTKATYRFCDNDKVTPENILKPHEKKTSSRIKTQKIVLAIQDTTSLNFTSHPGTEGLGYIGCSLGTRGFLVHTTLAITPEKVPLGIIFQETIVRPPKEFGKRHQRYKRPIEQKESRKWINSLQATQEIQKQALETVIINIGDREADIYELFQEAIKNEKNCKLLVRAARNRRVREDQEQLWPYMEKQPVAKNMGINVPRKGKKKERIAEVEIRYAPVKLKPPKNKGAFRRNLTDIDLWAIYLKEPSPPEKEEGLSWMLLTTLKVESIEEALRYLEYYSIRFWIETFHKILKSGCGIEELQLETVDRLKRCLALYSIVAWRIMFLTMIGRSLPAIPCTVIFEEHEWKALCCFCSKSKEAPKNPPGLREATRMVGKLGGFLGRRRDGEPGVKTLWLGMQKLATISAAWLAFRG